MSDGLHRSAGEAVAPRGNDARGSNGDVSRDAVLITYRRYAPVYDRLFGAVLDQGRRELARCVGELSADRVLEVGVGTGLTFPHYPPSVRLTGIDLSREMLAKAAMRARAWPQRHIELSEMDAEHMQFEDASFDCVTLPYVLSVTPNPARLVAEIRRVCRPDGRIVLLNHFSGDPAWRWLERPLRRIADKVGFRSEFDFERHVTAYDWRVESVRRVNVFGLSRLVVLRNR